MVYVLSMILCALFFTVRFFLTKTLVTLLGSVAILALLTLACFAPGRVYKVLACLTFLGFCGYHLLCHHITVIPDMTYPLIAALWGAMAIQTIFADLEEEPANEPCKTSV